MTPSIGTADPITLSVAGVGLLTTALAAWMIPALKAMGVDPVNALRGWA